MAACVLPACAGEGDDDTESSEDAISQQINQELPWEVTTDQGETVLPNVFYAEASENEQVMPLAIRGHAQVDRLVYPTIGNPNLYVKADKNDSFMAVLRLEESAFAHLKPDTSERFGSTNLSVLKLTEDEQSTLAFYLVAKSARRSNTEIEQPIRSPDGRNVIRIRPSSIRIHSVPADMPAAFKQRRTLRVMFDQSAMASVPPGLYDLRFEAKQGGRIVAGKVPNSTKTAPIYEYQYNAVRVFDKPADEYSVINVTDTQVSMGLTFKSKTLDKLGEFVQRINASTDSNVRNAAFITFNGDLHNGGSPETVLAPAVASTYNDEAVEVLDALKELNFPIFLTVGNHDGYVATGQMPFLLDPTGASLRGAITAAQDKAWPDFQMSKYEAYLAKTAKDPGGLHVDVFNGQFSRREGRTFAEAWKPVPQAARNMVLYDGIHQWHRTYGPAYAAFSFGKNHYINLNSYDLRQHRRTGWGMYVVNYGGGISQAQMSWVDREITRLEADKANPREVVLLAHHDPRGGHHGKDYPYLYPQVDYRGLPQVIRNFIVGSVINPKLCALVPKFVMTDEQQSSCLHDGLQEWMMADPEFDCADADRMPDGRCNIQAIGSSPQKTLYFSSIELQEVMASHPSVRTVLLGHTHYNTLEILQSGDEITPPLARMRQDQTASLNVANPVRGFSFFNLLTGRDDFEPEALTVNAIWRETDKTVQIHQKAGQIADRALKGTSRELVILRLTSNADITRQKFCSTPGNCRPMFGFSTFKVAKKLDPRSFPVPQINEVTFFLNDGGRFEAVRSVPLQRTHRIAREGAQNPLAQLFTF